MDNEAEEIVIELSGDEGGYAWLHRSMEADEAARDLNEAFRTAIEQANDKLSFDGGLAAITAVLLSSIMAGQFMGKDPYRCMAKVNTAFNDMVQQLERMAQEAAQETIQ